MGGEREQGGDRGRQWGGREEREERGGTPFASSVFALCLWP